MSIDSYSENFTIGQCWISDAELNLGVGLIQSVEFRHISIYFSSCGEQRTYAKQTAPLTRLSFSVGDSLKNQSDQTITITEIKQCDGIASYTGLTEDEQLLTFSEDKIHPIIQFNRSTERLFNNQIDTSQWFSLRHLSYFHLNQLANNDLLSLTGSRTSLIPHQLYIAHNVAGRYAPRVLLADEVGLGKTIEAGMIIQQQLSDERIKRVLIVVPESLIHQWLVEMLRRFNCHFSIFDEQRCLAEEQSSGMDNPFFTEQLVICSLDLLLLPKRMSQLLAAQWDMLVVDEAHHLRYNAEHSSQEYLAIEQLAQITQAVLLLTATPEQLGKESHFARLRLLDKDRFPDFDKFLEQEKGYQPIADLIDRITKSTIISDHLLIDIEQINQKKFTAIEKQKLLSTDNAIKENARHKIVNGLLDRHGTGRLLFRNTRSTMKGFPQRFQKSYALDLPLEYQQCYQLTNTSKGQQPQLLLSPEILFQQLIADSNINANANSANADAKSNTDSRLWSDFDPRINWLVELVKSLAAQKILVIAAYAQTAKQLNIILKQKFGIISTVFHQHLSLLERDRSAAYFADIESGCQVLVCSEIGSEGRNFQFSHQLVFFDLPLNPDLLEQRIGRLDRIGQNCDIQIHIPYFKNSAQQFLYQWFKHGLDAFENICPAAQQIFSQRKEQLLTLLHQYHADKYASLDKEKQEFITSSRQLREQLNKQLHQGRDRLLELNSCRSKQANNLMSMAQKNDDGVSLYNYLEQVFDVLGVDSEIHKQHSFIIHPGENMQLAITGLEEDGLTCTCQREVALSNEDIQFLTWTHPLVIDMMGQILASEMGNTSAITLKSADLTIPLEPGTLLLESIFIIESMLAGTANIQQMFELLLDNNGSVLSYSQIKPNLIDPKQTENIDKETIKQILYVYKDQLKSMISESDIKAKEISSDIINQVFIKKLDNLKQEKIRLEDLQKVNPAIRKEEIDYFNTQIDLLNQAKAQARHRLDAMRVIVIV